MSAIKSVMDMVFGQKPAPTPAPAPVTNNPAANPAPPASANAPGVAPNGVVPPAPPASPLDKFTDLWEPVKADPNAPPPAPGLTNEKILEAAGKVDFKQILNPESLQAIAKGGDEAVAALGELLNKTAQVSYGQSVVAARKLMDVELGKAREEFAAQIPNIVKRQTARESLISENPAFTNPAVQPVISAIQDQLAIKYPKATAAELNDMAKKVLSGTAEIIGGKAKDKADDNSGNPRSKQGGEEPVDWDSYLAE